jgi:hypothetical protein
MRQSCPDAAAEPANTRHDCEVSNTYYACSEVKRLSEPEPHRLADLEEARDRLLRVFLKDGYCIAVFRFGAVAIPEELEPKLQELVGRKCTILRIENRFLVRDLEREEHAAR